MNNYENAFIERFSLKSLFIYICKQYKFLFLMAILGMICLSALNFIKGKNYSDTVKETDVISEEELEKSKGDLATAEDMLEAAKIKLENQKILLTEYKDSLSEFESKWKADIYIQTSADNRFGVSTVYQISGQTELFVDQMLNSIKASLDNMYDEIASQITELSPYNLQRLFTVEVNLNQNQISIKVSSETEEKLKQIQDLYHTWMDTKVKEYQAKYPDDLLESMIVEENEYVYYDADIFDAQRTASDKKISIQNNINSVSTAIIATQNEITNTEAQIKELARIIDENEKLWSNTIVLSEEKIISKTSIIIYLILGGVIGSALGIIYCCFRYMYGKVLKDTDDMRYRTGEKVIGTLYSPVYSKKDWIQRELDRWNGVCEIIDMDEQIKRLAVDLSIQLQKMKQTSLVLTGTIDANVIEELGKKLSVLMKDFSVYSGGNPLHHISTAQKLIETDAVVTVEKVGVSQTSEIRKLRDYLNHCHIHVLGGITT